MKHIGKILFMMAFAVTFFMAMPMSSKAAPNESGFDANYYRENYKDVVKEIGNDEKALENYHFTIGVIEGKYASELDKRVKKTEGMAAFDADYYAAKYKDVVKVVGKDAVALLEHYLTNGLNEGRYANARQEKRKLTAKDMFNAEYYMREYPDVVNAVGTDKEALLRHFITNGAREGRYANAALEGSVSNVYGGFHAAYYAEKNPEVAAKLKYDTVALRNHYIRTARINGSYSCEEHEQRVIEEIEEAIREAEEAKQNKSSNKVADASNREVTYAIWYIDSLSNYQDIYWNATINNGGGSYSYQCVIRDSNGNMIPASEFDWTVNKINANSATIDATGRVTVQGNIVGTIIHYEIKITATHKTTGKKAEDEMYRDILAVAG